MRFDPGELVAPYQSVSHALVERQDGNGGWIVWRTGTGGNAELLHLRVRRPGHGVATELVKLMLAKLKERPPYATVFGFTRVGNESAHGFYRWAGFSLTEVGGVYDDGRAVVFSARYDDLCHRFLDQPEERLQ